MEDNIANIINNSIFTGDIKEELRGVCIDYFCGDRNGIDSDSSDSEEEKQEEDVLAVPLQDDRPNPDIQVIEIQDIPFLQDIENLGDELLFDEGIVEEVEDFEEERENEILIGEDEEDQGDPQDNVLWDGLVQHEETIDFDAEIRTIKVEGCCKKKCSDGFSLDELLNLNQDSRNLDFMQEGTNLLDLFILGQIKCMSRTHNEIKTGKGSVEKERQRQRLIYMLMGKNVCERLFLASNAIKIKRFKRLLKHYKEHGTVPPVHKNFKRTPKKTCTRDTLDKVVMFIRNHAEENALFMPGRLAHHKVIVKLLPSSDTKKALYFKYKSICEEASEVYVGLGLFYRIWKTFCSDVVIMKPRTDLCEFCQQNMVSHAKLSGSSEEEKFEFFEKCRKHLEHVSSERASYKDVVKKTVDNLTLTEVQRNDAGMVSPNSYNGAIHYSFDFAQQIHIPFDSQQPGPIYFLTPFKVGIFGIMNDTLKNHYNFLIPESVQVSKGANAIVSYLHYFLENHGCGEIHGSFHADNCVAQNKNNIVIGYFIWRIINCLHESITLSFLPVGHTKFSCDWAFGIFKKKFRKSKASSLVQVEDIVKSSTPSGLNKSILTGTENGDILVPIYDWLKYFQQKKWKAVCKITKYSHFYFSSDNKGVVETKTSINGNSIKHRVTKTTEKMDPTDFPQKIDPLGLTYMRKQYLYEKIRPFCEDPFKDSLCPHPGPEPASEDANNEEEAVEENADDAPPPKKTKKTRKGGKSN